MLNWDLIKGSTVILFFDMAMDLWPIFCPYIIAGIIGSIVMFIIKRSIRFFVYTSSASNYEARTREKRIFALVDLIDCLHRLSSKAK